MTSPTPTKEVAATPVKQEPVVSNNGTTKTEIVPHGTIPAGDAKEVVKEQTAPSEDTFTSIDVKSLSPELKSKYDAMLTDYKKKTTEAAQIRKEAEERLKEVQGVVQDPRFVQAYSQLNSQQKSQVREDMGISDDEFNKAFESKDEFAKFVQKVARVSTSQSQQEIVDLKASLTVKDFKATHADYDEINKYKFIEYQLRNDPRAQGTDPVQWQSALNDAYSNGKRVMDELIEKGRQAGLERIQQKVSQSTEPPTDMGSGESPTGDPRNWTTAEAIANAKRGIRAKINF
jgi:hypothetical protein